MNDVSFAKLLAILTTNKSATIRLRHFSNQHLPRTYLAMDRKACR
ncbi:hypothetical protein QX776_18080 [Alteromonadaceae bacterium BrNp21-10]|nr:hypothetical protein [Alteromonadaceae bacterium BrNp21-10]